MLNKNKKTEYELKLIESKQTQKKYFALMKNDYPIKFWDIELISSAGMDLINDLINIYDAGYNLSFQFPLTKGDVKELIPERMKIYGEPDGLPENFFNKKLSQRSKFYKEKELPKDNIDKEKVNITKMDVNSVELLEEYIVNRLFGKAGVKNDHKHNKN